MKTHFRYHHIISVVKLKKINKDCKYCQDWLTTTTTTTTAERNV
jgi:hypothetical protein